MRLQSTPRPGLPNATACSPPTASTPVANACQARAPGEPGAAGLRLTSRDRLVGVAARSQSPQAVSAPRQIRPRAEVDTAAQPVTYTLLAAYFAGYIVLSADASSLAAHALTLFPLAAPLVLPARSALVGVPLWEHVIAVMLTLACIYALVRLAGRVYARGCSTPDRG